MANGCKTTPAQIVIYATANCPDCQRVKSYFEASKIPYVKTGLEGNEAATEFVMNVNHGNRSVPTVFFPDGSILVEPSWEELRTKLFPS